ncbi:MAG TPA: flippase activity-associated protein Agl23, partial [Sumerlaeia bacterium]|nr:flippase activity-associated protein Agl23 [Sumerlaeia bacterium]
MTDREPERTPNSPAGSENYELAQAVVAPLGRLLAGAFLAGLVVLLLVSRFAALDYRAFHHDESIHALHSWKVANQGAVTYKYDPVYHGPFLYHFGAIFHKLLPDTDYTARTPYAVVGLLLVLAFWLLRDVLGRGTALLAMAFLILSPTVNYFSRFARNDVYQTAWLAGTIVSGVLYLRTARVRHLTAATVFLALSYCTKENSYINSFALCSFVVAWAVVRLIRSPRRALEDVFIRYLPLTRLLIAFGCFSVFVFLYVAVDCRLSPETGLIEGLTRVAAHSTSIVERTAKETFEGQSGYFTAPGRQDVRAGYIRIAFAAPICLLLLAEGLSLYLEKKRTRASLVLTACLILLFYVLMAYYFVSLAQWVKEVKVKDFLPELTRTLTVRALLLGLVATLFVLPDFMFPTHREAPSPAPEREEEDENAGEEKQAGAHGNAGGIGEAFSLWEPRLFGFWGFVAQIMCAAALYLLLFCSLGTNARVGSSAGLYRYLEYWFKHQTGEFRIWGAWWYYFPRLVLYEAFPLVLAALLLSFFILERLARKTWTQPAKSRPQEGRAKKSRREKRKGRGGDEGRESPARTPSVDSQEAADRPSGSLFWRPVPLPLLCLSAYLVVYTIGIYAILNEKVPWLLTYQAFAVSLFAALLAGHWLAVHPRVRDAATGWLVDRMVAGGGSRTRASSRPQANPGVLLFGISVAALAAFGVLYAAGQHVCAVFVRPDAPSELFVYTGTTHEFAEEMGKIRRRQERAIAEGKPLTISVEDGASEWPCAWYFRNCEVRWKTIDPAGDIQILDDSLENRRKLERRRGKAWEMEPFDLRAWWFWHGNTAGLPGGNDFSENLRAFLLNSPNNHRHAFAGDAWPKDRPYPVGFAEQIRRYVFGRTVWFPTGGQKVLVCRKT